MTENLKARLYWNGKVFDIVLPPSSNNNPVITEEGVDHQLKLKLKVQ